MNGNIKELDILENKISKNSHVSDIGLVAYGGSYAYGLATAESDVDLRGFVLPTVNDILRLYDFEQVETMDGVDATLYSLNKLTTLLLACNPNVIELIGLDRESILVSSPVFEEIIANKQVYISRKCANTFGGYATAQLRRIENAMSRDGNGQKTAEGAMRSMQAAIASFPDRYQSYKTGDITLKLSENDPDNLEVLVDFNVKDYPAHQLRGLCGELDDINKNAANIQARNRKKAGKLSKHASHLIRLLAMGAELLEDGVVNTKRVEDRDLLLDLKQGMWFHEDENSIRSFDDAFWDLLNDMEKRFDYAKKNTSLPEEPDFKTAWEIVSNVHRDIVINRK